jgi:hypothetical protein
MLFQKKFQIKVIPRQFSMPKELNDWMIVIHSDTCVNVKGDFPFCKALPSEFPAWRTKDSAASCAVSSANTLSLVTGPVWNATYVRRKRSTSRAKSVSSGTPNKMCLLCGGMFESDSNSSKFD